MLKTLTLKIFLPGVVLSLFLVDPGYGSTAFFGGRVGLSLPRSDYIRYADTAPTISLFYSTSIGRSSTIFTQYDLSTTFFKATNRSVVQAGQPYARYLREYGYSVNAGLLLKMKEARMIGRSLIPELLIQPGFYLMNTEIDVSPQGVDSEPTKEHQFMGRIGLRLGSSIAYYGIQNWGLSLDASFDIIPAFERGSSDSIFRNDSHPAKFWTISLGLVVPIQSDDKGDLEPEP